GNMHSADGWDDVLKPVVARYQGKVSRIYFRADAAFAMPEVYQFLEAERIKYAIRLPANQVLQNRIGYLLTRSGNDVWKSTAARGSCGPAFFYRRREGAGVNAKLSISSEDRTDSMCV